MGSILSSRQEGPLRKCTNGRLLLAEECKDKERADYHIFPWKIEKESIRRITSLMLTRKFQGDWFKITFLGEAETIINLGNKS